MDCYQDSVTRDKLIFPSAITHILTHMHVTIPPSPLFHVMGVISKETIQKSVAQLAAKWPRVETIDAAPTSRSSSSSTPFSSFRADFSFANIMEQLQHIHADFGSHLDHLSNEMCQMKTKISRICCHQSCLSGFALSPSREFAEDSSSNGEDDDDVDGSGSSNDDEMMASQ